jgi:endonuclease/exonuclease/phosphatase (EEP) superfamily protein YafD
MAWRRGFSVAGHFVGWAILAGLAVVAVVRIWQPGSSTLVIGTVAVSPVLFLVAWPLALVACARRRWRMASVALLMVAVDLALVLPAWRPWDTSASPVGPWRLRVLDANVRFTNPSLISLGHKIEAFHPDLVVLEEATAQNLGTLERSGAVTRFHWRFLQPAGGGVGLAVWSDQPIRNSTIWSADGHPEYSGEIDPPGRAPIAVLAVHTYPPYGSYEPSAWLGEMAAIEGRASSLRRPAMIIGDFNATNDMKQFQSIVHAGFTDAAVSRGQGWRLTWPRDLSVIPPITRPDHLLYSRELTVTRYQTVSDGGSDHRAIEVTVAAAN